MIQSQRATPASQRRQTLRQSRPLAVSGLLLHGSEGHVRPCLPCGFPQKFRADDTVFGKCRLVKPSRKRQAPAKTSTPPTTPTRESASTYRLGCKWWILLIALIVVFSTIRCAAAWKELWLDEIWAIRIVEPLGSPIDIWTKVRIDNHCLYSLYLYFLDTSSPNWIYRLPSLLAGLGSMVLVGCISREQLRWNSCQSTPVEAWATVIFTVLLIGCCHMNVHFDSEARGYSLCVCFCLLAFYCLLRGQTNPSGFLTIGYWAAIVLGILSHPIAIHMLVAGGIWSSLHVFRTVRSVKQTMLHGVRWHLVPWAAFLAFYFFYLRFLKSGGAADVSRLDGSSMAWCYTLGLPLQVARTGPSSRHPVDCGRAGLPLQTCAMTSGYSIW